MNVLFILYVLSIVVSVFGLLWLSAIEFKSSRGYVELTLSGVIYSVGFGILPVINIIMLLGFLMYMGEDVILYSGKPKNSIKKLNL